MWWKGEDEATSDLCGPALQATDILSSCAAGCLQ